MILRGNEGGPEPPNASCPIKIDQYIAQLKVSMDDVQVMHVEQASGYVREQSHSPNTRISPQVFSKASVFHEVVHES